MSDDMVATDSEVFRRRYRVVRIIGKGSFGEAVLVRSKADGKRYVAKTVDSSSMTDKEKRDVQNEIRILAAVKHPNIILYHEHFLDGAFIFIIMEYADGGDLSTRIKEAKSQEKPKLFDPNLAMFWFLQICMALKYLHDNHILHRDLKSANIFLTSKNVVKLGDFGISTVLQTSMACAKTICGTPYYFSPELCQSMPYNNKSDVWALGVVFYESLTLQRPFNARSLKELLKKIKVGQFDPLPSSIPNEMRRLCCCLLQVNPAQRPNINRILESAYVQECLKTFSVDLEKQAEKDRAEYEAKRKATGSHTSSRAPGEPSSTTPPAPTTTAPASKQPSQREQMAALRGMNKDQMKQMLANQPTSTTEDTQVATGTEISVNAEVDDDGEYIAQKQALALETRNLVGKTNIDSHPEEFGDPADETGDLMASMVSNLTINGVVYGVADGRAVLEKALKPERLKIGLEVCTSGMMSGLSNAEIQRELDTHVGSAYANYWNAIGQLAILEGKTHDVA